MFVQCDRSRSGCRNCARDGDECVYDVRYLLDIMDTVLSTYLRTVATPYAGFADLLEMSATERESL